MSARSYPPPPSSCSRAASTFALPARYIVFRNATASQTSSRESLTRRPGPAVSLSASAGAGWPAAQRSSACTTSSQPTWRSWTGGPGLQPAVAPLHERHEHREQFSSLVGQPVSHPRSLSWLAVRLTLKQAFVDEIAEPGRSYGLADADALGEFVESGGAVERLTQDQQGRAATHDLEGACHRALGRPPSVTRIQRP